MMKVVAGVSSAAVLVLGLAHFAPGFRAHPPARPLALPSAGTPVAAWRPAAMPGAETDELFLAAARAAWASVQKNASSTTGLVNAQPDWQYPTTWDMASAIAAYYSARGLGLMTPALYKDRMGKVLSTLAHAKLYKNVAFGRSYDARTGQLVTDDGKPTDVGSGYSAIDVGRLLIWLKIVANHDPSLAAQAEAVAHRVDASYVIRNGYLHGETITAAKKLAEFQEGRLGYEQYAAAGYALWGMHPDSAMHGEYNAVPTKVLGLPLMADKRGLDRLTSEPLILQGLELGYTPLLHDLATQALAVQVERFKQTGLLTIASEDAIALAPHYFYYYCIYCDGQAFTIEVHAPGLHLDEPRWLSTKAVFAWHALMPSAYTAKTIAAVKPALDPSNGWATGVYEKTFASTKTYTLNTAAVVLESALYNKLGHPLLTDAPAKPAAQPAARPAKTKS